MFEHFTDAARRILVQAQEEARRLHDSSIDPAHLLLGLLREDGCIAAQALSDTGVDYDRAREVVEGGQGQSDDWNSGRQPLSQATKRVIERSVQISWARADGGVDAEDLLTALLEQDDETTEAVLAGLDVTPEELVQRVDALLAGRNQ